MIQYVAFLGRTPDGAAVPHITVLVYRPDGELVLQDEFPLAEGGLIPRSVELAAGDYLVTGKADGFKFELHQAILVPSAGSTVDDPVLIELAGESTQLGGAGALPCRVSGRVASPSPSAAAGGSMPSHGTTFDTGPTLHSGMVTHRVWFKRVGAAAGEMLSMSEKETILVNVDRYGYFEALLKPEAVYRVLVPNQVGSRYIRTPEASAEADIEALIDASRTESLSELV